MRRITILTLTLALVAGVAAAQSVRLGATEARRELFGVELIGVVEGPGDSWRECVEPGGRTQFQRGGEVLEGRLAITDDGQACFTYRGEGYSSCFAVQRVGRSNYRFDEFVTRSVRRGVRSCNAGAPIA